MKTGIELIADERKEQIEKHGRTAQSDIENNESGQMAEAAVKLISMEYSSCEIDPPFGWEGKIWDRMESKPYRERLIIAGALIAAEIDRLMHDPDHES